MVRLEPGNRANHTPTQQNNRRRSLTQAPSPLTLEAQHAPGEECGELHQAARPRSPLRKWLLRSKSRLHQPHGPLMPRGISLDTWRMPPGPNLVHKMCHLSPTPLTSSLYLWHALSQYPPPRLQHCYRTNALSLSLTFQKPENQAKTSQDRALTPALALVLKASP